MLKGISIEGQIDRGESLDIEVAIRKKSLPAVRFHARETPMDVFGNPKFWQTPLCLASQLGLLEIVQFLISRGAEIDEFLDIPFRTPLINASRFGHVDVVVFLLNSGANINFQNSQGDTALHHAVYENKYDIVKLLIAKGADIRKTNKNSETPYQIASRKNYRSIKNYMDSITENKGY